MNNKIKKASRYSRHASVDQVQNARPHIVRKAKPSTVKQAEVKVVFGSTSIVASKQNISKAKYNIKAGQTGLARALKKIVAPGVKIVAIRGVPLFHADPQNPGKIIRTLDKKREYGVLENGRFKACG